MKGVKPMKGGWRLWHTGTPAGNRNKPSLVSSISVSTTGCISQPISTHTLSLLWRKKWFLFNRWENWDTTCSSATARGNQGISIPVHCLSTTPCCKLRVTGAYLLISFYYRLKFLPCWYLVIIEMTIESYTSRWTIFLPIWFTRQKQNHIAGQPLGYRGKIGCPQIQDFVNSHVLISTGHKK